MRNRAQDLKKLIAKCSVVLSILLLTISSSSAQEASRNDSTPSPTASKPRVLPQLPPLPAGVLELKFSDFFKLPVGPRGLEITAKLQQMDGRRVRILGYMVHQADPWTSAFLLAPVPVQLHEHEYGQADDLPPSTIYVRMPNANDSKVPYTRGLMLITGTLHVGARDIEDGRRTWVVLDMDSPAGTPPAPPDTISSDSSDSDSDTIQSEHTKKQQYEETSDETAQPSQPHTTSTPNRLGICASGYDPGGILRFGIRRPRCHPAHSTEYTLHL